MKIKKVLNNNVVSSEDKYGREIIVMGKGIGFQKKLNEEVNENIIEKVFRMPRENASQYEKIVEEMPYEHITLASKIIQYASDTLDKKLNKNIFITLTDHLNYAIERKKQGVELSNALLWEVKKFYNDEYRIGLKALDMIYESLDLQLSDDEAGFIAIHIVNAEIDGDLQFSAKAPVIIKDILNIIKYTFNIQIDETTISYERLITHLRYFIQRIAKNIHYDDDDESGFAKTFLEKFQEASCCAYKISDYAKDKFQYNMSDDELMYITIHIERVVRHSKNKN